MPRPRSTARRALLAVLCAMAFSGLAPAVADAQQVAAAGTATPGAQAVPTLDADRSAALVQVEDDRLAEVRRLLPEFTAPYRLGSANNSGSGSGSATGGGSYTLVLTARPAPYTINDLLQLAPQTFVEQRPGTYLLSEHLVTAPGATLELTRPGGLDLRLASSSAGFVSLTGLGGQLKITGTATTPVTVSSWDTDHDEPDTDLADGRAYVRVLGGQLQAQYLEAAALGFWSGRTGGIAITATDRLITGPLLAVDPQPAPGPTPATTTVQPAGPLSAGQPTPPRTTAVPAGVGPSRISNTLIDGNAYGLFVSGANDVQLADSRVRNSLVSGVVLHRDVLRARISRTSSTDNAGDGFRLDRATTGVTMQGVTASRNAGNGVSVSGGALAQGPSPSGATTRTSGGNSVVSATIEQNGRYGVAVQGGQDLRLQGNRVRDNEMGIVVAGPAERVTITGNTVTRAGRHGIAVIDGVRSSDVRDNDVDGAATGLYVRDSQVDLNGNTVVGSDRHGVSLVGEVGGSQVADNILTGTGTGAVPVDRARATGTVTMAGNQITGWQDTALLRRAVDLFVHPMNALWMTLAVLLFLSALRSRIAGHREVVHPYAHQMAHHGLLALPACTTQIDLRDQGSVRLRRS